MRIFLLILCSLFSLYGQCQTLYGFVLEQNSGKKPVEGVKIKSTFGANQVTTAKKGEFTLSFQDARPGKSVILSVEKDNWVITDKGKLETNLPEDPYSKPHTIILCRKEVWDKQNKDYKTLLENYIKKSYEKEKAALNKLDKQYQLSISSLQDKYTQLEKNLTELAELYSKTNLDDLTSIERNAFTLFKEGKIDECIELRKSMNSENNFLKAKEKEKRLDSLEKVIDTSRITNKKEMELHQRNLKEEAKLAQLKYDFKTAEEKLAFLANNDSTDHNNAFDYAVFLNLQNNPNKAIVWYHKAFDLTDNKILKGVIMSNLGALYYRQGKSKEAEKAYITCMNFYKQFFSIDTVQNKFPLAIVLNNLSLLQIDKKEYDLAKKNIYEALEINTNLLNSYNNNLNYVSELAGNYINLGLLEDELNNFDAAENNYLIALKIIRKSIKENENCCQEGLAEALYHLGQFYEYQGNFNDAENNYREAVKVYKGLAQNNTSRYNHFVYNSLNSLAIVLSSGEDLPEAEKAFQEAIELGKKLSENDPENHESTFAQSLNNLGQLFRKEEKYKDAEKAFQESLAVYTSLSAKNPDRYEPERAGVLSNLGVINYRSNNYNAAEKYLVESLNLFSKYLDVSAQKKDLEYCFSLTVLGLIYDDKSNIDADKREYFRHSTVVDSILSGFPEDDQIKISKNQLDKKIYNTEFRKIDALREEIGKETDFRKKITLQKKVIEKEKQFINNEENEFILELAFDLGNLSWYLLFDRQFAASEKAARESLFPQNTRLPKNYSSETEWVNTNLAHAILYQGKYAEAEKIYLALKDKPINNATYKETFLADLIELEKAGITHKDVEKIRILLKK